MGLKGKDGFEVNSAGEDSGADSWGSCSGVCGTGGAGFCFV